MARKAVFTVLTLMALTGKVSGTIDIPGGGRLWQSFGTSVNRTVRMDGPGL